MQDNKQNMQNFRRVKIVSTLGPATKSFEMIEKLYHAGVNVFRLNFSHGSHDDHKETYNNIRAVSTKYNVPLAVLADMEGPKLRVGKFANGSEELIAGQSFRLDLNTELGSISRANLPHPQIFESLKKGDALLVDDGKIMLQVEKFGSDFAETTVVVGGTISNFKGVNFPSGILKLSPLTEKDLKDLDFSLSLGVDFIGLSFVQLPSNIEQAREIIKGRAKIISKIEKPSAIQHISEIINLSDGIMVARGDLGVEIPTEQVPVVQKMIIRECRRQSTPVIVATQMLDSMTFSPVPTRAEASDVANAVYDGTDAVMLSGETTVGKYPIETVATMSNIISQVEADPLYWDMLEMSFIDIAKNYESRNPDKKLLTTGRAIAMATKNIAETVDAKVIVAFSTHGTTVNRISHQRPTARILSITTNPNLYAQMCLNWGVTPFLVKDVATFTEIVEISSSWLKQKGWVKSKDKIIVVAGIPVNIGGITNSLRVIEIE